MFDLRWWVCGFVACGGFVGCLFWGFGKRLVEGWWVGVLLLGC